MAEVLSGLQMDAAPNFGLLVVTGLILIGQIYIVPQKQFIIHQDADPDGVFVVLEEVL
jgi:hypothetical protein